MFRCLQRKQLCCIKIIIFSPKKVTDFIFIALRCDLLCGAYTGPWQMWIRTVSYKATSSFWPCTWWTWLKLADLYPSRCLKTWYLPLSGNTYTQIDTLTGFINTFIITTTDVFFPHFRGGIQKSSELVNGTGPCITPCLIDTAEIEPAQKTKSSGMARPAHCMICFNVSLWSSSVSYLSPPPLLSVL